MNLNAKHLLLLLVLPTHLTLFGQVQKDIHYIDSIIGLSFDVTRTDPKLSVQLAKEAKALYDEQGFDQNAHAYANILKTWAMTVGQNEPAHLEEALALNDRAIRLFKQYPGNNPLAASAALNTQANLFNRAGKVWAADSCYRANIELRRSLLPPGDRKLVLVLRNYGQFLSENGDLLGAEKYYQEALQILENKEGKENNVTKSVVHLIGSNLIERGNFRDGLKHVLDAYAFYDKNLPEDTYMGYISNSIGVVYKLTGDYDRAIPYFERATLTKNRDFEKSGFYRNLGESYSYKHEYASAQVCFTKALDLIKDMPENSEARLIIRSEMAQNEINDRRYDKGISQLKQVLSDFGKIEDGKESVLHDIFSRLGGAFLDNGQLDSAAHYFSRANDLALRLQHTASIAQNYCNLSKCMSGTQSLQMADSAIYYSTSHRGQPYYGQNVSFIPENYAARLRAYIKIYKETNDSQLLAKIESSALETMLQLEQCRLQAATDGARQQLVAENAAIIGQVVEAFLLIHDKTGEKRFFNTAFEMAERGKTLSLSEAVRSVHIQHMGGLPDSLLTQKRVLESNLAWIEKTIW
jgi:tetratricopeptide (TPR) repeat protein